MSKSGRSKAGALSQLLPTASKGAFPDPSFQETRLAELRVTGSQQASPVYLAKKTQLQAHHFTLIKAFRVAMLSNLGSKSL